ncbi:replication protein, partial [Aneurinibacillus thermoaerophilus]|uniref:replication protein n=1 Tax=Aneurinibacillus thermoaerophilus TaxID=143495 RepID=UPI002E211451|nr:replication protein [Aneurinibacillus thermoaerophilus]
FIGERFTQNTFYIPQRRIENIRQLRALYSDIDFYLLNLNVEWILGSVELLIKDGVIPEPNLIIFSGRGIVFVWLLEPVPYQALPLWQALENYFSEKLAKIGADKKATDATRVFRLAGSTNGKNGEMVEVEYRHEHRYELRQLQRDYLPELDPDRKKKKGRPKKIVQLHNIYRLHFTRLRDLARLVELRGYDVSGYRETICFLYRYWSCCILNDPEEALRQTKAFNEQFTRPLPVKEVVRATKSAEKAWQARSNAEANRLAVEQGYPGAGYNISNKKLISWLDITPEEQQQLETIIDANKKQRRNTLYQREKRRSGGVQERSVYLEQQKEKTEDKLYLLRLALQKNPKAKQKELAQLLGVSDRYIRKLLKQI